jgi:hypothetical protein
MLSSRSQILARTAAKITSSSPLPPQIKQRLPAAVNLEELQRYNAVSAALPAQIYPLSPSAPTEIA